MVGAHVGLASLALAVVLGVGTCAERATAPHDAGVRPDGAGPGSGSCTVATSSSACPAGQVCNVTGCDPKTTGVCVPLPSCPIPSPWTPVCDCNDVTWANDCYRLSGGSALRFYGDCGQQDAGGPCLDSDLEPNDAPQVATNLDGTLAGHPQGVSLYGVEICGSWDVDYYSFTVTAQRHALVVVSYQRSAGELEAMLLDPALTVLAQGASVASGLQLEADLAPQSSPYYLLVRASPTGSINKYDFSITFSN